MANEGSMPENQLAQFRLAERFTARGVYASCYSAESYLAVEQGASEEIILQVARAMIGSDSRRISEFVSRIQRFRRLPAVTPEILSTGVDGGGAGYIVMRKLEGALLRDVSSARALQYNVFRQLVTIAAACHDQDLILGDIGNQSFILTNDGQVLLLALCGADPHSAKHFVNRPTEQTMTCFSPEQLRTDRCDKSCDIFSLGVLGYRVLTGIEVPRNISDPTKEPELISRVASPTSLSPEMPVWADYVLGKCMTAKRSERFQDAPSLLKVIEAIEASGEVPYLGMPWGNTALVVRAGARGTNSAKNSAGGGQSQISTRVTPGVAAVASEQPAPSRNLAVMVSAVLLVVLIAILGIRAVYKNSAHVVRSGDPLTAHAEVAPPDLKPEILAIQSPDKTIAERKAALSRVGAHPDPIGYSVLVTVSRGDLPGEGAAELQSEAEKLLVDRLDSLNEPVTSKSVARWFETVHRGGGSPSQSAVFGDLLRAADSSRAVVGRTSLLRSSYSVEPSLTKEIAAALALDNPQETEFTNILREFLSAAGVSASRSRSLFALIAADKVLTVVFADELAAQLSKLSDDDLRWVLLKLPSADTSFVFRLAEEIVKRQVIEPLPRVFLEGLLASEKYNVPRGIRTILIRATSGDVRQNDLTELTQWASPELDRMMLAICAVAADPQVKSGALEFLMGRSLLDPAAKVILQWVKEDLGERRDTVAHAVGILALGDTATASDVKMAFDELMAQSVGSALFTAAVKTKQPLLIQEALSRLGAVVPPTEIAELLDDEHKEVRIAAIQALRGQNNVTVLQAIFRGYERETDPEVKAIYEEEHWVTRDRQPAEGAVQ